MQKYDNLYLMLINEHEIESGNFLLMLELKCLELSINTKKIWVINNNTMLQEHKEKLGLSLNVHSTMGMCLYITNDLIRQLPFDFTTKKDGFFLCHNRRPRLHRYAIIYMLLKSGLINDTDWSFINYNQKIYLNSIFTQEEERLLTPEINYVSNISIKKSKYEQDKPWFDGDIVINKKDPWNDNCTNWGEIYEKNTYINTYVNITTESLFDANDIHITEKSFKPFFFLQFPLILASKNHVKELKRLYNLDLFEDMIDYSYDSEPNSRKRFFMFFNELKRIHENKQQFIDFYANNKERFMENQKKVIEIKDKNFDHDFLNSLI